MTPTLTIKKARGRTPFPFAVVAVVPRPTDPAKVVEYKIKAFPTEPQAVQFVRTSRHQRKTLADLRRMKKES